MLNLYGKLIRMTIRSHSRPALLAVLLGLGLASPCAFATEADQLEAVDDLRGGSAEQRRNAREAELEAIRRSIEVSARRQSALREEINALERDGETLSADLIATAQRMRATEQEVAGIEGRIEQLHMQEDGVRRSLRQRRAVMAEVLMALQRMGRTPPPAMLSRPEDALAAIRGSILAGSVLPDIRVEAEGLAADLSELTELSARIESERDALRARYAAMGEEQTRIDLLVAAKQSDHEQTQAALAAEQSKATQLADEAQNLTSLIRTLESEVAAAARAAEEAREAARTTARTDEDDAATRLSDTSRIAPAIHFADAKGLLTPPVLGPTVARFGEADGLGGTSQGLSLSTRPGMPVLSPADAWVVYAGPFRSYGQVLILNAGDNYHIVLAGMERIDAALGQFVLAGEPVAVMGATRVASIGEDEHTSAQPLLYVEFRKDGTAIDSGPWWPPENGEVNG